MHLTKPRNPKEPSVTEPLSVPGLSNSNLMARGDDHEANNDKITAPWNSGKDNRIHTYKALLGRNYYQIDSDSYKIMLICKHAMEDYVTRPYARYLPNANVDNNTYPKNTSGKNNCFHAYEMALGRNYFRIGSDSLKTLILSRYAMIYYFTRRETFDYLHEDINTNPKNTSSTSGSNQRRRRTHFLKGEIDPSIPIPPYESE